MNLLLIGQPNVGKSSIYNILVNKKINIIHKDGGTTKDWHQSNISFNENFILYDAPGVICDSDNNKININQKILELLIPKIDCFLFVVDYKFALDFQDILILRWLRTIDKQIVLLINKKDNEKDYNVNSFYEFGINDIFFLSCAHKLGFDKLQKFLNNKVNNKSPIKKNVEYNNYDCSIAIFGKPNAGKSTFLNQIVGYDRAFTSIKAGTTTDCVEDFFKYKSKNIKIIDTSGISKKSKILNGSIGYFSIRKSLNLVKQVNSCILLIDCSDKINRQDKRIIKIIASNAKSLIIVFNKIDLIKNKLQLKRDLKYEIDNNIHELMNIKLFFITSFSKKQSFEVIKYIYGIIFIKKYSFTTSKINKWLKNCTNIKMHPMINNKKINFKYAIQIYDQPITIKIFCNHAKKIKQNYIRYLKNDFNKSFLISDQNIKLVFSQSQNPYKKNTS